MVTGKMTFMDYMEWEEYFRANQDHFKDIAMADPDELIATEKMNISSSIQQFQRGENSEGRQLFAFARTNPDPVYLRCISLFVREEQAHARVLGLFMDKHNIPRISKHWVDRIFRLLRKAGGLENTIRVLLIAEVIARIYYVALQHATGSELLKRICRQILKDEDQHIAFQCFTLGQLIQKRSAFARALLNAWSRLLMTGTIIVVWWHHKKVYKAGGYHFHKYFAETFAGYFDAERNVRSSLAAALKNNIATF